MLRSFGMIPNAVVGKHIMDGVSRVVGQLRFVA